VHGLADRDSRLSLHRAGLSAAYTEEEVAAQAMRVTAQFLRSAVTAAQFPKASVPEVAFLGRSNVGKSSLLNALVGSTAAKISSTPGRTRAINFFRIADERGAARMLFADLPGYGYAKISKSISETWPGFIEPYLTERATLGLCICLVDLNVPPQASDGQMMEWLRAARREFAVVATKVDKLSGNERTRNLAALKKAHGVEEILPVSAKTGYGIRELWRRIERVGSDLAV
jgi:GTP-binding protein